MRPRAERAPRERGFSLVEVLITLVVTAFGLLGIAGFVTRVSMAGVESNQRARALALMEDMAERIRNNRPQAPSYVAAGVAHGDAVQDCSALAGPALDLCEWNNLLFGANDAQTDGSVDALHFRGCVTQPFVGQPVYVVSVAWASLAAGTPPADLCAAGEFGDDTHRRAVRTQVRVPNLSA